MNILITSAGIRGYIVKYFKETMKDIGRVYAADCSLYAPALYDADDFFILPKVNDEKYIVKLLEKCKKYDIKCIVSLNDVELPILSNNKKRFEKEGINIVISEPKVIDICYDKYKTYNFLKENGFKSVKTYVEIEKVKDDLKKGLIKFPILIKPRWGSASKDIVKVSSKKELENQYANNKDLIIQEFIDGEEFGVDIFNNSNKKNITVFAKKKIKMRAGETDKAVTYYDEDLIRKSSKLAESIGLYGPGDIDVFKYNDEYFFMEINPRFGGGYPLAHSIGAGFPKKIIDMILGKKLKKVFIKYPENVVMMKQYEIVIRDIWKK